MKSYSVADAAQMLNVNEETIRRWIRDGKLKAKRAMGRGGNTIQLQDVVTFANIPPRAYLLSLEMWLTRNKIAYEKIEEEKASDRTNDVVAASLLGGPIAGALAACYSISKVVTKKNYQPYCIRLLADDEAVIGDGDATALKDAFSGGFTKGVAHSEVDKEADFIPHEAEMTALTKKFFSENEKDHVDSVESVQAKQEDTPATTPEETAPEPEKSRNFLDEIAQAKQLMDMGVLTPEEFADIKARLIAKI